MSTIQQDSRNRESVMKLLSDDEIALVSNAETPAGLLEGEEYLDLENLHRGVRRAKRKGTPVTRALPRKSVAATTWNQILEQLAHPRG